MNNILTIDLEDWYQTQALRSRIKVTDWDKKDDRLPLLTLEILRVLRSAQVKATFFVVAYNAKRNLSLLKMILKDGHELGLHGYYHTLVYKQTPEEFRKEMKYSKELIEDACQTRVIGFRAPNWSINRNNLWALEILSELGFLYDSSLMVKLLTKHIRNIPIDMLEIPRSTFSLLNFEIPFGGGVFFRAYPYFITKRFISDANRNGKKVMVYIHPWEFDLDQHSDYSFGIRKVINNFNRSKMDLRFKSLLADFKFSSVRDIFFD
ncbi:polysaccharide deacetylase family protein [Candidatus Desantisbacteria bacterium]|nr:polysaccharide deacetylase family protein [Candidatus Desantisbacteria bacterium]MBI4846223.1 polysaccharide deacetylase family protein [Candidatus Omnitrophota bacterium]